MEMNMEENEMGAMETYRQWMTDPVFDEETKAELAGIEHDEAEIKDRFYKELEFGTGGLRGVLGAGTNRMNLYTVGKATQGLANYIKIQGGCERGVAIAYDSRRMSPEFARHAALCLNANGIKTYLFSRLAPTPMLSFAVRRLSCMAGIVITASHNPPEYNGYKVYWEDGAQITYPRDAQIISEVKAIRHYGDVKWMAEKEATEQGLFAILGNEIEEEYQESLEACVLSPEAIRNYGKELKIVYTPLHGTGRHPVWNLLKSLGFTQVRMVREQMEPDGDFPTVSYPNPEDPRAFHLALKLAEQEGADLILATDPDADRLGVYVKDKKDVWHGLTGNMSGILIGNYLLSRRKELGILPADGAVVKTIVTTRMAEPLAARYGMTLIDVLTGFKYIGEQMKLFEQNGSHTYQFGFEESYGCLVENCVRDKDAVSAVMTLCEAAAYYRGEGKTLWEEMENLYERYGYFKEGLATVTLKGADGAEQIAAIMDTWRKNPPKIAGGFQVLQVEDYEQGVVTELETGACSQTGLPKSNVLRYTLGEDAWFCVRPSGTEPKIKYYFGVKGVSMEDADRKLERLKQAVLEYGRRNDG